MENLKIGAEISNLKKILADDEKFYQIPDYQRPYSWDKENISDLIDDLVSAFSRNDNENYFCGSIVLLNIYQIQSKTNTKKANENYVF